MKQIRLTDKEPLPLKGVLGFILILIITTYAINTKAFPQTVYVQAEGVTERRDTESDRDEVEVIEPSGFTHRGSTEYGIGWGEPDNGSGDIATTEVAARGVQETKKRGILGVSNVGINLNIDKFTQSYRGSRMDSEYLALLREECKSEEIVRLVVAISVAESGMGRDLAHRHSNFWGWFKNADRNYDPSREVMAKEICNGIGNHYSDVATNRAKAVRYSGNDGADGWMSRVQWALSKM